MSFTAKVIGTLRSVARHPLNRRTPLLGAMRFVSANVAVRLLGKDVTVRFPNGTRLVISPRMKGAAHFINPGLCEFDEMGFVLHFLRSEDLFVDVGANVGAYTVLASGVIGARTIAFEPNPSTFKYLERNIAGNELSSRACGINAALGATAGELLLTDQLGTENYVSSGADNVPTVRVRVETLDKSLQEESPALIKADVEGFETQVFAGASTVLQQQSLLAMIIERSGIGARYGFDEALLHARVQSLGFIPCAYSPLDRYLRRVPSDAEGNIIYVRSFEAAQQRLREAQSFEFAGQRI